MSKPKEICRTKVVGVTHDDPVDGRNRQDLIRQYVRVGTMLTCVREPENPVDPDAVAVILEQADGRHHLGYLFAVRAKEVLPLLDNNHQVMARVLQVSGGTEDKPGLGVNVQVLDMGKSAPVKSQPQDLPTAVAMATPSSAPRQRRLLWIVLGIVIALCSCVGILAAIGST